MALLFKADVLFILCGGGGFLFVLVVRNLLFFVRNVDYFTFYCFKFEY